MSEEGRTKREKAQIAGAAIGGGTVGGIAYKKTRPVADFLMAQHNATSGVPPIAGRPQKAAIQGLYGLTGATAGAVAGNQAVKFAQDTSDVYRQQRARKKKGKNTKAFDILAGTTLGGTAVGAGLGAVGASRGMKRAGGSPKAVRVAGARGALGGAALGSVAGGFGGLVGAHNQIARERERRGIAKAYVGGGKFMPASALGKEKLKANTRSGMYKPGRNYKNERIARTIRRGRADIDAWSKGGRTTKEGGVTRISAYRPDEVAQAAAWRKGGKRGEKVLLVNRSEPIIGGMNRKKVMAHEMAHLKPKRSEWRMGQIQSSAVKSGREEGRADMAGGMHHRKYSKDMRRNAAGSMSAGFRILTQHRPSAYASSAAHEGTRKATDAHFRGLAAMNASEVQPGLFGRKAMQGYRQVQQNIARSQGDPRGRKSKRTGVAKAYNRKQLRDERGRWKGRKGPAGIKDRFYNPKEILWQDKTRIYHGKPRSKKAIQEDLKSSAILGPAVGAATGGLVGLSAGRHMDRIERMFDQAGPKTQESRGLSGNITLDAEGHRIDQAGNRIDSEGRRLDAEPEKKPSKLSRLVPKSYTGKASAVGLLGGAGIGALMIPAVTDRHSWREYPRNDSKEARRKLPRQNWRHNPNLAYDYDLVRTKLSEQEAKAAFKRREAAMRGAKGSTDPMAALIGAGVGAATAAPEKTHAHLVRKQPVSKAMGIVRPLRPPAVGKSPKMMLTPKAPTMPGIKPVKPKKPPGVKLPQLPRPPRPGY